MDSDIYIDPSCECDAPTFVDFTNMTSQYDDNADDWFAHTADAVEDSGDHFEDHFDGLADCVEEKSTVTSTVTSSKTSTVTSSKTSTVTSSETSTVTSSETSTVGALDNEDSLEDYKSKSVAKKRMAPSPRVVQSVEKKRKIVPSPTVTVSSSQKKPVKSTEQRQIDEIKRMQLDAKKKLKDSRRSFQRLIKGPKPIKAIKGSKPPTEIKEFHFSKMGERSHAVPGSVKSQSDSFMPMAEFILKYQNTTPPRFRRKPVSTVASSGSSYSLGSHITIPKTPKLLSRTRVRPVDYKGVAEAEEEVVSKVKQYHFKANLLNPDVIHKGGLQGVPRKRTNPNLTHPVSPYLATKKLALTRKALHDEDEQTDCEAEDRKFLAQPMPNFAEIKGLPAKRTRPVTQPESPAIKKRRRLNDNREEEAGHVIKPIPLPNFDKVFVPQYSDRPVVIQPFSFEERDRNKTTHKTTLVERILRDEKKPAFKAQPLPSSTFQPTLLPKHDPLVTKPQPFSLHTDVRGEQHSQKWKEQVENQQQNEKKEAEFKAKDASILYAPPFLPNKSTKPLTCVENVILHSDVRSNQRAKYETEKLTRTNVLEVENMQRRALRDAEDAKKMFAYRKSLVHKALPIGH